MFLMYVSVVFATVVPNDNGPHGQPWKHTMILTTVMMIIMLIIANKHIMSIMTYMWYYDNYICYCNYTHYCMFVS